MHVINLSREAMRQALESEKQVSEAGAAGASLNTGVTVDLSRKNIKQLPEEVVDIVNNGLERSVWADATVELVNQALT